ncbi:MDR family NADP-dependent oxidoreductase [Dyella caseinilytica]|uniref:NADP-dependent oxidoreductase n=1 Tax=Dyella caseinilytica TaxID=1849581 RepID=A0ABX7GYX2_9GAMM|nr:NADP-dependent oxidoreductase [Dyella caseinilytica]QRN55669.1 NADP-dependent oxidoreductase [Dyella caseinilytica]GGA03563.1 NADP-dependent oxidoreductase [Dyella caseinilytica]
MLVLPSVSRIVRLVAHPDGALRPEHFEIAEVPVQPPTPNEVLVCNRWFRVSISTRLMASKGAQSIKGIPFPPLNLGDTLADGAIGEVVQAPAESDLHPGDLVLHGFGWREYATVPQQDCVRIDARGVDPAVYLGHGWTAYAALTHGVQVHDGDVVFVSSGAGAIGSMAGQIARKLGAGRVIGSTGSEEKARWMKAELGYDEVVIRGATPITQQLAQAAPDGIDVYVDMVGGEPLQAAASLARHGARFVLLGALSAELAAEGAEKLAPVELDTFQLIVRGVTLRGYSACEDDRDGFAEWVRWLSRWQHEGKIISPSSRFQGIEQGPFALSEACAGNLKGVVLVEL